METKLLVLKTVAYVLIFVWDLLLAATAVLGWVYKKKRLKNRQEKHPVSFSCVTINKWHRTCAWGYVIALGVFILVLEPVIRLSGGSRFDFALWFHLFWDALLVILTYSAFKYNGLASPRHKYIVRSLIIVATIVNITGIRLMYRI